MTTLPIRAPQVPAFHIPGLARAVAVISAVLDVYSEALTKAHEAEQRYPFSPK